MPKDYFRFKQFLVRQDKCAMKVCTDACLFGSLIPTVSKGEGVKTVLDIGVGTGLLSLMYAQRDPDAIIDAIEIDDAAAQQAQENFESSPWKKRLNVYHTSVQQFVSTINKKYDLIISNPPFYENDLKSGDKQKNLALHSVALKVEELINIAHALLNDKGNFFVLIPYHRTEYFLQLIRQRFFINEKIFVRQTPKHNYFRSIFWLTKKDAPTIQSEIIIMNEDGKYTKEFSTLLKDYYLYL